MNHADIEHFREVLQRRQTELRAEGAIELIPEAGDDDTARKVDDDAAPLAEMNQVIASRRNLERTKILEAIAEALERIDDDPEDFGTCDECSEPIRPRRLEVMPWALLCVRCKEQRERSADMSRRRHLTDYR